MNNNLGSGRPRTEVNIVDASIIKANSLSGFACVQGVTLKGEPFKPVLVPNWEFFVQEFGGLHPSDDFPLMCKRALDSGAKLYVSRVAHWDTTDWEGAKATATITLSSNSVIFTAKNVGAGYNGIVVTVSAAISGDTTKVDITEQSGLKVSTIRDVTKTTVASELSRINAGLKFTRINTLPTTLPIGTATLAGGTQTYASIVANDFIGSRTTETKGWFAFDDVQDSMRIFNFNKPVFAVDSALKDYCEMRKDMRFYIRPALSDNLDYETMIDYRMGTGAYSHTPIDSFWGDIIGGNVLVSNPDDVTETKQISSIADVGGLRCAIDGTSSVWASTAGATRGKLKTNLGVPYNLGSVANAAFFDQIYQKQINPVINDSAFGVVFWGNRTLLRDQTKKLKFSNSADLAVYIKRTLLPLIRSVQFDPNSPEYWNLIYRKVRPFIVDELETGNAIRKGEGKYWFWQGDQDAKSLDDLTYNTKTDIDSGIYKARFVYVDVSLMEYIGIDAVLTDSNSVLTISENI